MNSAITTENANFSSVMFWSVMVVVLVLAVLALLAWRSGRSGPASRTRPEPVGRSNAAQGHEHAEPALSAVPTEPASLATAVPSAAPADLPAALPVSVSAPNAGPRFAPEADNASYKINYVESDIGWSGSITGDLPLKTLTYKQYECLEDARYGFKIVALPPSERNLVQPMKTRAHGLKTVASLVKHQFLSDDAEGGYVINDRGLYALEICTVRY